MTAQLFKVRDVSEQGVLLGFRYMDLDSGQEYADSEGLKPTRKLEPRDLLTGEDGKPVRGTDGRYVHMSQLANVAHTHNTMRVSESYGRPVRMSMWDGDTGKLVQMDLGISDVHTNTTMTNVAQGYHLGESAADIASPVIMVPKASNLYYTWDTANDFARKIPNVASAGGEVAEVNPTLSSATYTTVPYALGGFLPTEVQSNADTPLQPFTKMTQVIVDALRLEREYRVSTLLQTSGTWNSGVVQTLAAGSQWNGGAASDPIANLHLAIESSYMPVTHIVMSELVFHDFCRNPSVQKFFTYKDGTNALPTPAELSALFKLPPIYVAAMKYTTGGALTYMWGNHVVLLHLPSEQPPTSQMEVMSNATFRWMGGTAPDGSFSGGLLVRSFFDNKRGPRGGTKVVCVVNDVEKQLSAYAGGLILNAHR